MTRILLIVSKKVSSEQIKPILNTHLPNVELFDLDPARSERPNPNFSWSDFNLILLSQDLGRESTDGFVWLHELIRIAGVPPIVFLGTVGNTREVVKAMKLGAADFLNSSELSSATLIPILADVLSHESSQIKQPALLFGRRATDTAAAHQFAARAGQSLENTLPSSERPDGEALERFKVPGYEVQEKIGEGGMSTVFLAHRRDDKAPVVLKLVNADVSADAEVLQRFMREYELIFKLRHPNVVKIYERAFARDYAYIAMEYFPEGDLQRRIRKGISEAMAFDYLSQIASGLAAVHELAIVHRDLKPGNVLFRKDGTLAITDFGVAQDISAMARELKLSDAIVGTPYYMSPEQAVGGHSDVRSDLYSLGVMFYQMLTGNRPFTASTVGELIKAHVNDPIPKLQSSIAKYQPLIDGMMAKDPDERFQTAHELLIGIDWVQ